MNTLEFLHIRHLQHNEAEPSPLNTRPAEVITKEPTGQLTPREPALFDRQKFHASDKPGGTTDQKDKSGR